MFSTDLAFALEAAYREAIKRGHAYFCIEHVLFALLHDSKIIEIVEACGGSVVALKRDLEEFFDKHVEKITANTMAGPSEERASETPLQTPAIDRVIHAAILHMRSVSLKEVTPKDLFVAIFNESDSHAVAALESQDISRLDVVNFLAHGISKDGDSHQHSELSASSDDEDEEALSGSGRSNPKASFLARYTENLTQLASEGKLDPVIGREMEVERAIKILARRQKNNPLFLGDPGVGKTAMAHALAQRIISGKVPARLKESRIYSLQVGTLVAGTKFRGEFEERVKGIVNELKQQPSSILFIDEIHQLVGAGSTGSGSMDAANILKPALSSGGLRCVGSTTHEDFKKNLEKDRALIRRFSTIELREPTVEECVEILKGLKVHFESYHDVKYSPKALQAAAELSAKHINDRHLPDKAIDVLDEAGAANSILPGERRKRMITEREVERVVAAIARVPVRSVSSTDERNLAELEANLTKVVFGQDKAVAAVAQAIKRSRANLKSDNKPVGSFMFAGPTGVGKTELAKALAKELGIHFHRFDMTEYMEKHAVARLIGAPPGYVGYDEGGQLSDLVRRQPYAVLLFDEIEKAHEDIYNILLQVMDDAVLTDSKGRKVDFRNVIVILTTNAGSERSAALGFGETKSGGNHDQAVKKLFKPEFRNRLDEIVYFAPLSPGVIRRVVDKFIRELEAQLEERKITLVLQEDVLQYLAAKGFDPLLGARPMARVIQREIKDQLADQILFGELKRGGQVKGSLTPGDGERKIQFEFKRSLQKQPVAV